MRIRFLIPVTLMVVAAGCTSTSEGSPRPVPGGTDRESGTSAATGPGAADLPYAGAPAVENPLDTARFQQDPCQSLTEPQATELGVRWPGEPRDAPLGRACTWRSQEDRNALVEVAAQDEYPHGLSAVYQGDKDGKWVFFEKLAPVDGYPVVSYGQVDQRDTGGCRVEFGASDEIAFDIVLQLSADNVGEKDPCETAARVAGMVVRTMKAS